jgi:hypothetical protein
MNMKILKKGMNMKILKKGRRRKRNPCPRACEFFKNICNIYYSKPHKNLSMPVFNICISKPQNNLAFTGRRTRLGEYF